MRNAFAQGLACFLSLMIVWPFGLIQAASKPTLMVSPLGGGEGNRRARTALMGAFREEGHINVIEEEPIDRYIEDRNASSKKIGDRSAAGEGALKKGIKAYRSLDIDQAISHFEQAKQEFRGNLIKMEDFQALRATQMYLAMTFLAKKNRQRAKDEITEAILLDPGRQTRKLPSKHYSPEIRKLYDEVRDKIMKGEHGSLEIITTPSGAVVYVDGQSLGASPIRVRELPVGEHHLRVEAEGREVYARAIMVVAGDNRIPVELSKARSIDVGEMFSILPAASAIEPKRSAFLDEMGISLGADIMVFLAPGEGTVKAQLYDLRSQETSPTEEGDSPKDLAVKLLRYLDADGYVVANKPTPSDEPKISQNRQTPPTFRPSTASSLSNQAHTPLPKASATPSKKTWYTNKWIWMGVGGFLAAGAGVLFFTDIAKKNATTSTLNVTIP